ncbi:hypothetical protein GCM10022380_70160 [Amycolatopsis tucumanensis]|uniref:Uncharacterized protein n=1 Tax=Amycolatopsis tucumanensis TaxID=401106 RepID=A0ABP7JE97_9PSEU
MPGHLGRVPAVRAGAVGEGGHRLRHGAAVHERRDGHADDGVAQRRLPDECDRQGGAHDFELGTQCREVAVQPHHRDIGAVGAPQREVRGHRTGLLTVDPDEGHLPLHAQASGRERGDLPGGELAHRPC